MHLGHDVGVEAPEVVRSDADGIDVGWEVWGGGETVVVGVEEKLEVTDERLTGVG